MRKARRSSNRRPAILATTTSRAIRRETEFLADQTPPGSAQSTDDDSSPRNVPASSYIPYAQHHRQANQRAPPSTRPHAARFPRRYSGPPLAEPNDRHDDSRSSGFESADSDNFPLDEERGDRDLLYMNEAVRTQPRNSLTMPDALVVAKNKFKTFSFHTPRTERMDFEGNDRKVVGRMGERFRMRNRASKRRSFAGEMPRDHGSSSASSASSPAPATLPDGQVELAVHSFVLEGNNGSVHKKAPLGMWFKKNGPLKTVRVEATPAQLSPTCLFASGEMGRDLIGEPYKPTELITCLPQWVDKDTIVYRDSPFEIGLVGMSVSAKDFSLSSNQNNELLMFSLHRDPDDESGEGDALPFVHYDPTKDGGHFGTEPDTFIPIPASRSLFMVSDGKKNKDSCVRRSVNVRFKLLELDRVDESIQVSLAGIEELGNHLSQFSRVAPLLGLLSPALNLASALSRRALESYARPDRVITTDMNFLLAEQRPPQVNPLSGREMEHEQRSGEYLRYGYYFFLEKPVDAKLYASIRTFPHVQLLMKRMEDTLMGNEKRYFPLTGVSYLVVRVTPRVSAIQATRRPIRMSHVQRLEDLMKSSVESGGRVDAQYVAKTLASLANDLGIIGERRDEGEEVSGQEGSGDRREKQRNGNRNGDRREKQRDGNGRARRGKVTGAADGSESRANACGGGDSASS